MLSRTTMLGPTEPCALWQSEHETSPSRTGWREGRLISARMSLWQAKHTLLWVSLSRTGSATTCNWWQDVQATSLRWWALNSQCMRVRPWWQVRQISFFSADAILEKRRGMGLAGFLTCSLGSPWHIRQPTLTGARESALVPCLPPQITSALAWQLEQYLPLLMSSWEGSWARAPAERKRKAQHAERSARSNSVPNLSSARTMLPTRVADSCRELYFIDRDTKLLDQGPTMGSE